ncbi:Multidrug resistance protein MdtA precursor [Planctomycetes bacterium Poly30]|uniref:Multidrug resistance protein MdtA n=1 Tax=Saltatorellus ferox TaxID=2528018 RepID=A0A518EM11_9BACT|nr:Multidrug resistance protein MdtA precursor [Planctomycetes bacterium Poly30]
MAVLVLLASCRDSGGSAPAGKASDEVKAAVPVDVAAIELAPITLRRTFSGTLEAATRVQIAARVGGRISSMAVDIGDHVKRGQLVAEIDASELDQAVLQADADLAVAKATVIEAEAAADFATRALERLEALDKDGVASKSELDSARAQSSARKASVAVAKARVQRAEAQLGVARIQRNEAEVLANWSDDPAVQPVRTGDDDLTSEQGAAPAPVEQSIRAVAERYVDEGELVAAGAPLLLVVGLQPIVAVVFVPERDYARVVPGALANLTTDAYPERTFRGVVTRVAPVFSRTTRQVRVELRVENEDLELKPGMFVRATLELASEDAALVIPFAAITRRNDTDGVFLLPGGREGRVQWVPVRQRIREDDLVSIESLPGGRAASPGDRVVTLGQELCDDGSLVVIPDDRNQADESRAASNRGGQ